MRSRRNSNPNTADNLVRPVRPFPVARNDAHYAGFDLSLTASGIVVLDSSGLVKERHVIKVKTFGEQRLVEIEKQIASIIAMYNIKLVCIEGYGAGVNQGAVLKQAELGGVVRVMLHHKKIPYKDPRPTQLKKFATGVGGGAGGSKDQVTMFAFKDWGFQAVDNNEADGYILAQIAIALDGNGKKLKKHQQEVIDQILNPEPKKKKKKKEE